MQFKNLENQEKEQSSAAQLNSDSENQSKAIAPPPLKLKASAIQKKANEEEELSVQAKKDNSTQFADSDDSDDNSSSNTGNGTGSNPPPDNNAGEPFQLSSENSLSDNKSTGKERYNYSAASKGSSKLPKDVRGKMENAFQADFSNVNIHTNSEKAKEVGAYAFTQGEDIHFAPGQYQPFSLDGQKLIGHELTHVEHQRNGKVEPTVQTKGMPVNNDQKLEKEADEKGTMAAQGKVVNIAASGSASSKGVSEPVIQKSGNESGLVSNEEQDSYIGSYVNIRGFVRASNGIRLHTTPTPSDPDYVNRNGISATIHTPATRVKIIGIGDSKTAHGWSRIEVGNTAGWIESHYIKQIPLDPALDSFTKEFYYVDKGDNLETVINTAYKGYNYKTGNDRRTIAEAFSHLNQGNPGVTFSADDSGFGDAVKDTLDPFFEDARRIYRTIQLQQNSIIRLPSVDYINFLRDTGQVGVRPDWMNSSIEIGRGIQGFMEGIVVGFIEAGIEMITGLWDLLKGLFTGELIKQAYDFYKKIEEEGIEVIWNLIVGIFNGVKQDFIDAWNNPNPREKWKFFGKIIGMVLFEVVLAILTGGAVNALKQSAKVGRIMNRIPGLRRVVRSGDEVVDAIGGRGQANEIAEAVTRRRGSDIAREMGFPDAPNGYHWHRSPDGSLDVRRNSGNNGPRKEFDENSGTFRDRPEPDLTRANVGNSTQFDNLSNAQRQRLDDLNGDRNTARTDRDAHEKGTDEYNEANHRVIQQSHQLGEEAAEMYMESLGGNRIFPDGDVGGTPRSGEFDQIWEVDGQIYIVEAKGGSSGLGSRSIGNNRRAQQGTREYMDSILDNMDRNGQGDLATRIRGADAIDDLNYIQVRQPISRTGELGPISVSEFNL